MLLAKTEKALDALQAGPAGGLDLQDRRILILTDGKRSLNDLVGLLGAGILPSIDRLMREGFIADAAARPAKGTTATPRAAGVGGAFGGLLRAATEAVQARTEQVRAETAARLGTPTPSASVQAASVQAAVAAPGAAAAAPVPAVAAKATPAAAPAAGTATPRRSLAATRMYVLDMLQFQRNAESAEHRVRIQCSNGPDEVAQALVDAVQFLVQASPDSYGQRVLARVAEILPEEALPRLDAVRGGARAGSPPALSIVA